MAQYMDGPWKRSLFACNYARTNIINYPVYKKGRTASACKTGTNPNFKGLCSIKEPIDPNSINVESEDLDGDEGFDSSNNQNFPALTNEKSWKIFLQFISKD